MTIPVVCAILVRDERVLLAQRPVGKHLALKWEFPGGKVESGESAAAALVREMREELGCDIEVLAELSHSQHTYDRGTIEMIPFVCALAKDSPEPHPHEHAAIVWSVMSDLLKHDLAPADYPVVDAYRTWLIRSAKEVVSAPTVEA